MAKTKRRNLTVGVGNHPYIYTLYFGTEEARIMPAYGVGPAIKNIDALVVQAIHDLGYHRDNLPLDRPRFIEIVDRVCELAEYKRAEEVQTADVSTLFYLDSDYSSE